MAEKEKQPHSARNWFHSFLIAISIFYASVGGMYLGAKKYADYRNKKEYAIMQAERRKDALKNEKIRAAIRRVKEKLVEKNIPIKDAGNLAWYANIYGLGLDAGELETIYRHCKKFGVKEGDVLHALKTTTPKYREFYHEGDLQKIIGELEAIIHKRVESSDRVRRVALVHQAHESPFSQQLKKIHAKLYAQMLEEHRNTRRY